MIPIADRYYGLREFSIADPDGFGVRFATALSERLRKPAYLDVAKRTVRLRGVGPWDGSP